MTLLTIPQFLKQIPGAQPRKGAAWIAQQLADPGFGEISRQEHWFSKDFYGNLRVTAAGAKWIREQYCAGALPGAKTVDEKAIAAIDRYCLAATDFMAKEQEKHRREELLVANPSLAEERDFSMALLNSIFFKHAGKGGGELLIGGIRVSKTLTRFSSNSGKSHSWQVEFSWVSPSTGERKTIGLNSPYAENRRNDAGRNWGLGRE